MENNNTTEIVREFVRNLLSEGEKNQTFNREELVAVAKDRGLENKLLYKYIICANTRVKRGSYSLDSLLEGPLQEAKKPAAKVPSAPKPVPVPQDHTPVATSVDLITAQAQDNTSYVPAKEDLFIKWGHFTDIRNIMKSEKFFPIYVYGPSGNGKTFMVEQAAAWAKRNFVRIQISPETDEDDLLGGFRLIDGNTVFCKGPVIRAMEEGAVVLLDEIDRATNKIMCLQSILEGKSVLIKKTGETVYPQPGFNVVATANTRGRGSDDGRYSAASIIDDAFLERFPISIPQPWATPSQEKRIILKHMEALEVVDEEFATLLTDWSYTIRKCYEEEGIEEEISTRRLGHVVETFAIFGDKRKAVELVTARFDSEVSEAMLDLFDKLQSDPIGASNGQSQAC